MSINHGCVFIRINMIKKVTLTNFFSFRHQKITLLPDCNVLIGINGSGKSNFLRAIKLLRVGVLGSQDDNALQNLLISNWGGVDNIFCKGGGETEYSHSIGLEYLLDGKIISNYGAYDFHDDVLYKIVIIKKKGTDNYYISEKISNTNNDYILLDFINGSGRVRERKENEGVPFIQYDNYNPRELALSKISEFDSDRYLPLTMIKKAIKDIAVYNYFDTTQGSKLRSAMSATSSEKRLLADGSNLPQILNTIKIKAKKSYRKIQSMLSDVNENFTGFDFNILGSGFFELLLEESELNSSIHVTHISDGTLRYLCLLAILYNPERGSFICLDEPEVGLHPDMIHNITNAIKEAAMESTFLIATHSENVVDAFKLEQLRIFEKDDYNTSVIHVHSESDFKDWYKEFNPGQMWRLGDLGGKRW